MPYVVVRHGLGTNRTNPAGLHGSGAAVRIPNITATAQSPRLACMRELFDKMRDTATLYKTCSERMMESS